MSTDKKARVQQHKAVPKYYRLADRVQALIDDENVPCDEFAKPLYDLAAEFAEAYGSGESEPFRARFAEACQFVAGIDDETRSRIETLRQRSRLRQMLFEQLQDDD